MYNVLNELSPPSLYCTFALFLSAGFLVQLMLAWTSSTKKTSKCNFCLVYWNGLKFQGMQDDSKIHVPTKFHQIPMLPCTYGGLPKVAKNHFGCKRAFGLKLTNAAFSWYDTIKSILYKFMIHANTQVIMGYLERLLFTKGGKLTPARIRMLRMLQSSSL